MTTEKEAEGRNLRKTLEGTVVSDKMNKTRVVSVSRLTRHPRYEKIMKRSTRFSFHDEENASREGDIVEVASTRPLSKTKRWRLVRVVKAAKRASEAAAEAKA